MNSPQIESFAQLLMDSNPQYIFWKDTEGVYLGCNKLYAHFCALKSTEDIIGTSDYDYMIAKEADICIAADKEVMEKGDSLLNFEEYVTDAHNVSRWYNINKIPLKDKSGKVLGVLGTMTDITESKENKKLIEEQSLALQTHLEKLKLKNSELEEFNYIVAHDLQEPVRNILNFGGLLSKSKEYNEDYMHHIISGAERMSALLEALLTYYVMGTQEKEMEEVSLKEVVETAVDQVRLKVEENAAEIHIGDLPIIKGYKVELISLFQNLIDNAIKYKEDSRTCKVSITTLADEPSFVKIQVEDNGIGMESDHIASARKIFQRLQSKQEVGGTGIGLSICSKVMNIHNGKLEIESQVGEGSKILLTFKK